MGEKHNHATYTRPREHRVKVERKKAREEVAGAQHHTVKEAKKRNSSNQIKVMSSDGDKNERGSEAS